MSAAAFVFNALGGVMPGLQQQGFAAAFHRCLNPADYSHDHHDKHPGGLGAAAIPRLARELHNAVR